MGFFNKFYNVCDTQQAVRLPLVGLSVILEITAEFFLNFGAFAVVYSASEGDIILNIWSERNCDRFSKKPQSTKTTDHKWRKRWASDIVQILRSNNNR